VLQELARFPQLIQTLVDQLTFHSFLAIAVNEIE
jgi:hypothetical protein